MQSPPQLPRCPNCGAQVSPHQSYCATCGYGRAIRRGWGTAAQVIFTLMFVLVGVPAFLFGGCVLILGASTSATSADQSWLALAIGGFVVGALLLFLMIRSYRAR